MNLLNPQPPGQKWDMLQVNPFPNKPCFLHVPIQFENTVGKGEIVHNEQFLLFSHCFLPVLPSFCHFYQIWNCHLQTLWLWKSLKLVVSDRVKLLHQALWYRILLLIQFLFNPFPNMPLFLHACHRSPLKTLRGTGENAHSEQFLLFSFSLEETKFCLLGKS